MTNEQMLWAWVYLALGTFFAFFCLSDPIIWRAAAGKPWRMLAVATALIALWPVVCAWALAVTLGGYLAKRGG